MDIATWVTAASGLVGALLGAGAALLGQFFEARHRASAERGTEIKSAIVEVLVQAEVLDMRANSMMALAGNVGSLNGLLSRMLGSVTPLDMDELSTR